MLIPVFIKNLNSLHANIPLITRIVLGMSNFLGENCLWIFIINIIFIFVFMEYLKTENGRCIL